MHDDEGANECDCSRHASSYNAKSYVAAGTASASASASASGGVIIRFLVHFGDWLEIVSIGTYGYVIRVQFSEGI